MAEVVFVCDFPDGITNRFTRNPNGPSPATIITGTGPRCDDDKFVAVPVKKGVMIALAC